jgi:hypothetical protein
MDQSFGAMRIEAHDPVTRNLKGDNAQPCRIGATTVIISRAESKETPCLGGTLCLACQTPKGRTVKIFS